MVGNRVVSPTDAEAEAKLLAARARDFERLGDWLESIALVEAAVLLDPDSLDLRTAALSSISQMLRQIPRRYALRVPDANTIRLIHRLQNRGLSHLAVFIDRDDNLRAYNEKGAALLAFMFFNDLKLFGPTRPRTRHGQLND